MKQLLTQLNHLLHITQAALNAEAALNALADSLEDLDSSDKSELPTEVCALLYDFSDQWAQDARSLAEEVSQVYDGAQELSGAISDPDNWYVVLPQCSLALRVSEADDGWQIEAAYCDGDEPEGDWTPFTCKDYLASASRLGAKLRGHATYSEAVAFVRELAFGDACLPDFA